MSPQTDRQGDSHRYKPPKDGGSPLVYAPSIFNLQFP